MNKIQNFLFPYRASRFFDEKEDWNETEWLKAAASNPAFNFLKDPAEDIYTLEDGRPFRDER